ncbi:unnamed protein product [Mytilus coruscus]|uniref:DUF5641 domain-containing protein n=1 Tax=Mytilus coruscus TaxID=42192 RepID=A0A6J8BPT9_MYTCO|nr:unnamed protein product [Mytilus coruscus]
MYSKLKAVRAGHRRQVTKLLKKFEDIEKNSDLDKDDAKLIADPIEQKQRTIVDLLEKILDSTSEEYMFNLESNLRKIRKLSHSDSLSQNVRVASTSLDPNTNRFTPTYPTNISFTNANVIHSNETGINVQQTHFDNFRCMQNTHRDLQSTSNFPFNIIPSHYMEEKSNENFWKLESLAINPAGIDEDLKYLQTYQQTSLRFEDMLPRSKWKLAIVEELVTGNDGHVRARVVKTSTGRTTRPIIKLYSIEVNVNLTLYELKILLIALKLTKTHVVLYQKEKQQCERMKEFTSGYMDNNL